jgi:hypothetical protein
VPRRLGPNLEPHTSILRAALVRIEHSNEHDRGDSKDSGAASIGFSDSAMLWMRPQILLAAALGF